MKDKRRAAFKKSEKGQQRKRERWMMAHFGAPAVHPGFKEAVIADTEFGRTARDMLGIKAVL